jgi:hypothetical protein
MGQDSRTIGAAPGVSTRLRDDQTDLSDGREGREGLKQPNSTTFETRERSEK